MPHQDIARAFVHQPSELVLDDVEKRIGDGSIYMHVDDADAIAAEWRSAGVAFVEPRDLEHGKREGSHADPDGNLIRFGSPLRR